MTSVFHGDGATTGRSTVWILPPAGAAMVSLMRMPGVIVPETERCTAPAPGPRDDHAAAAPGVGVAGGAVGEGTGDGAGVGKAVGMAVGTGVTGKGVGTAGRAVGVGVGVRYGTGV